MARDMGLDLGLGVTFFGRGWDLGILLRGDIEVERGLFIGCKVLEVYCISSWSLARGSSPSTAEC